MIMMNRVACTFLLTIFIISVTALPEAVQDMAVPETEFKQSSSDLESVAIAKKAAKLAAEEGGNSRQAASAATDAVTENAIKEGLTPTEAAKAAVKAAKANGAFDSQLARAAGMTIAKVMSAQATNEEAQDSNFVPKMIEAAYAAALEASDNKRESTSVCGTVAGDLATSAKKPVKDVAEYCINWFAHCEQHEDDKDEEGMARVCQEEAAMAAAHYAAADGKTGLEVGKAALDAAKVARDSVVTFQEQYDGVDNPADVKGLQEEHPNDLAGEAMDAVIDYGVKNKEDPSVVEGEVQQIGKIAGGNAKENKRQAAEAFTDTRIEEAENNQL